jgi:hypothetical protein
MEVVGDSHEAKEARKDGRLVGQRHDVEADSYDGSVIIDNPNFHRTATESFDGHPDPTLFPGLGLGAGTCRTHEE